MFQDSLAVYSIAAARIPDIAPTSQQPLNVKVSVSMSRSASQCQGQCHICLHERRGRVVVSTSVLHAVVRGSIRRPDMSFFWHKNLALNIRDCVSLMGRCSSVVGGPLQNSGKFVYPTLPVSVSFG